MMRKQGYESEVPKTESKWPSLPDCLLWRIKDELDMFDDVCLNAVCRDWWTASASYPRQHSRGNAAPCLLQLSDDAMRNKKKKETTKTARDFVCVSTNKWYTLQLPEFQGYRVFCAKQGWFLMMQTSFESVEEQVSVFLMNPVMKSRIELPPVARGFSAASFSIHKGYPHRVVVFVRIDLLPLIIKTTYAGDQLWTDHTYMDFSFQNDSDCFLISTEEHAYLRNHRGQMLVYNMDTRIGKTVRLSPRHPEGYYLDKFVTEFEGHIVEVRRRRNSSDFSFCRYNDATTSWEMLTSSDIKDTTWFISNCSRYSGMFTFGIREKGLKVYHACPPNFSDDELQAFNPPPMGFTRQSDSFKFQKHPVHPTDFHVVCYDLMNGSRETTSLPYRFSLSSIWVEV